MREPLEAIARRHPEYGYQRTTVELREAYGHVINRKVVQRLHCLWDLPLIRGTRLPKPSGIRRAITAAGDRINLLAAWNQASRSLKDHGACLERVIVHHDQDPVFTGYGWTARLLLKDQVRVSYALNGARDNPEVEAFISRFKTENRSLLWDAQTLDQLEAAVAERMGYQNQERRHSAIGYRAPATYVASLQPWP